MDPQTTYTFIPFIAKRSATDRLIEGPITADVIDIDGQSMDPTWLKAALPEWMQFGNIREQHDPRRAVGKAQALDLQHPVGPSIVARITDDNCWAKIEDRVLSGFSLGIRNARIVHDGRAPRGTIVGGDIIEVSVVDHPAVRKAAFTIVTKAAGGWKDMQSGVTIEDLTQAERMRAYEASLDPDLTKAISAKERAAAPTKDFAGPHRSFPIEDQDDVEAAAHLVGHAADPESVKERIIRLAKAKGLKVPPAWKDVQKMPYALDEYGNSLEPDLTKGAKPEDGKEDGGKNNADEPEDGADDHDGDADNNDDDFTCPHCHKDARDCECYKMTTKAAEVEKCAADFDASMGPTRPIRAGHPVPKGRARSVSGAGAMHDPSGIGAPFDGGDAAVRLDYVIRQAEHLVERMQHALEGKTSAGFSPNDTANHTHPAPHDGNLDASTTPGSDQAWHGTHATSAKLVQKSVTEEDVYKVAADVCAVAFDEFFADDTFITKGASPNSTKARLAELITGIAGNVAYGIFDQLEKRVAQVEKMPMPSKGVAVAPLGAPARTYDQLAPQERAVVDAEITKSVGTLDDVQRTTLLAQFLSNQWSGQVLS